MLTASLTNSLVAKLIVSPAKRVEVIIAVMWDQLHIKAHSLGMGCSRCTYGWMLRCLHTFGLIILIFKTYEIFLLFVVNLCNICTLVLSFKHIECLEKNIFENILSLLLRDQLRPDEYLTWD